MALVLSRSAPVLLAAALAVPAAGAPVTPPCAACVRWQLSIEDARRLLDRAGPLDGLELLVGAGGDPAEAGILTALAARGVRVGREQTLAEALPAAAGTAALDTLLLDLRAGPALGTDEAALRIKTLSTELRSRAPAASVGIDAPPETRAALWTRGLAPYVDFVVHPRRSPAEPGVPGTARWACLGPDDTLTLERTLEATRVSGPERWLAPWPPDGEIALGLRALRDALPAGLSPLPQVSVSCAGDACDTEVFLHPGTLDAVAIVRPRRPVAAVSIRPGATGAAFHPLTAADPAGGEVSVRPDAAAATLEFPSTGAPFLLSVAGWAGETGRFAAGLDVLDERTLTVGEVIARHQAAAARQKRLVSRLIAHGATVLAFQAPGLAAPVTVAADTVLYTYGDVTEIEQRSIRLNGMELAADRDGVPRLPIVEPERVSRPPMAIALDEAYRYRLAGRDRVNGENAYVVEFEPRDASRPLFRGRAWISARGFAMLRVDATQTGLRGAIVSSEQRDAFVRVAVGTESAWLLARSEVDQVYEGAGHRTPIQRVLTLDRHEPNPVDFAARLEAAHASASVMLRDTPQGFRYLRRAGSEAGPAARVVAEKRASSVRTLAMGAIVDPNISKPLPFAGLSYLDFDFLGTGAQVNAFFAGAFLQAALAVPSVGGSRWQLHGSGFATLAEYNDRSFREGIERYEENLRQRPARLSLALVRPLSLRLRARVGYELGYTRLRRSDLTAPDFAVPVSPLVHALRISLEGQRGPWTFAVWWSPARRQRWRVWGWNGEPEARPEHADFQRFGASLARSFVLSPAALVRVEGAWTAGTDLDRFSRYTFDAFENRLRGYPSAGLRFDRGAVLRSVATWNVRPRVRLDAFADTAVAHDPGFGAGLRRYSGVGAGLEAPLPWRTLLAAEWGYGFEGRDRDGGRGTHAFRATAYKVF